MDWKNALRPPGLNIIDTVISTNWKNYVRLPEMGNAETTVRQAGGALQSAAQMATRTNLVLKTWGLQHLAPIWMSGKANSLNSKITRREGVAIDKIILADQSIDQATIKLDLDCVIVEAELPKVIKYTQLQGRNGSVKEYIADDDWVINMKGVIVSGDKESYPQTEVGLLQELSAIKDRIYVSSEFINKLLDVTSIVIERIKLPQREGKISQQAFEIIARSDTAFELEING